MSAEVLGATRPHIFHVDLSEALPDYDYVVIAPGQEYTLVAHTEETRQQLLSMKHASDVQAERFAASTHLTAAAVMMPVDCTYRVHVKAKPKDPSQPSFVHAAAMCVPNPDLAESETSEQAIDWVSTAQTFLFHHPELMTPDRTVSASVMEHLSYETNASNYQHIQRLATAMRRAGIPTTDAKKGWATLVPLRDEHGQPIQDGDETLYLQQPTPHIQERASDAMTAVMTSTKNDLRLKDKKWMFTEGTSTEDSSENVPRFAAGIRVGETGSGWRATVDQVHRVHGMKVSVTVLDQARRQVRIRIENYFLRYLGAYIQFLDADMKPMNTPDWSPDEGGSFFTSGTQYPDFRGLGSIQPIHTILSIPDHAQPGALEVTVTFPADAVAAGIFGCGIGTGSLPYPKANIYGGIMTGLANLAIPTFTLGVGLGIGGFTRLYQILQQPGIVKFLIAAGALYFAAGFTYQGAVYQRMDWTLLSTLIQLIYNPAMTMLLQWLTERMAEGTMRNLIPFAGWMMIAINTTLTVVQMTMTIAAIATSPWNIPNRLATTIDSTVTILPDPRAGVFPQPPAGSEAGCTVSMIFQANRPTVRNTIAAGSEESLQAVFTNQLGGRVKFEASFSIGERVAAMASTGWLDNNQENTGNVTLALMRSPVELDETSVYAHSQLLTYQNGAYQWTRSSKAPVSTRNIDSSQSGNAISVWQGLALSQRHALLGWAWKAAGLGIPSTGGTSGTQLFAMQTADIPGKAMTRARFPSAGFDAPVNVVFDPYPPRFQMKDGTWVLVDGMPVPDPADVDLGAYWVDPRKEDVDVLLGGGHHLRKIEVGGSFDTSPDQPSFGRFPSAVDSLVLHPTGHVIAVNSRHAKIMVLQPPPPRGTPDRLALMAHSFAGEGKNIGGSGGRAGLLVNPLAVTCTYDGTILVLEWSASEELKVARIQAFDMNGDPVNAFRNAEDGGSPFLEIDPSPQYLDITCSGNQDLAYVHVLSYDGQGRHPGDYNMAVYQFGRNATSKNPLLTTNAISAARIATDMWRSIYALNWEMTTDGQNGNAGPREGNGVGPAGRTVPSVSLWLPKTAGPA